MGAEPFPLAAHGETAARGRRCLVLGLIVLAALGGCRRSTHDGEPPSPGAPVVLISIDTLRSDRLPAYGYTGVETPAIDRFRADAVLFARAYAHYPLTLPSHASLFTGQLTPENGIRDNAGYRLEPGYVPYLPRLLADAGYATGAFVSSFVLRGALGLDQGFDVYDDRTPEGEAANLWGPERRGTDTLAAALPWLKEVAGRPFLLFFHIYEPHLPHTPPEAFRDRWGDTYDGEIAAADAVVGDLLEALRQLGVYDDALIAVLSDHGEGLYDHGARAHGVYLYREAIQIPLLLKLPVSKHAGSTVEAPAQLIDLLPTVSEVLGLPTPEGLAGISLRALLGENPPLRPVFAETQYPRLHYGWSDLASLVDGRFHYIEAPRPELYDLELDPGETKNVLAENRRVYATLRDQLALYRRPLEVPAVEEDPEVVRQLRALGYLAAAGPVPEGPLPDPKDEMGFIREKLERAEDLIEAEDLEGAIVVLHELLEHNPKATDGWQILAGVLERTERLNAALVAWQRVLELTRGDVRAAVRAGGVQVKLGRLQEARLSAELAAPRAPDLTRALHTEIALAEGDLDRALELLGKATARDEATTDLRRRVGVACSRGGRHQVALRLLGELAEEEPTQAVLNALAIAQVAAGRRAEAVAILRQLLAADPEDSLARETAGLLALEGGRLNEARRHLERAVALDEEAENAWNLLGVVRFQSQDATGALNAWRRSVDLDPGQLDALYNLAFTAARLGRQEEARQRLRQYVNTAPPDRYGREIAEARNRLAQLGGD